MPPPNNFNHLPLLLTHRGPARLRGFTTPSPQSIANSNVRRQAHIDSLRTSAETLSESWKQRRLDREDEGLPVIPEGVPILLQVDPSLDLDVLREKFDFEIVAEQEEGYVIVAAEDIDLTLFQTMVSEFAVSIHGSARIAQVHRLFDDPNQTERLNHILSDRLLAEWPRLVDDELYVVDVGIACTGTKEIPPPPARGKRDDDASWARKQGDWSEARIEAYEAWDEIKRARETEIEQFAQFYHAEILRLIDGVTTYDAVLPDSFTVRLKIVGRGLRDFVLNYPYIFEVVEPDDIALPQLEREAGEPGGGEAPAAPEESAPTVCVIDSGIQENHLLIEPAIDHVTSHCYLPGKNPDEVGDFVSPGGHGTRIAGAILYGEVVNRSGAYQLPFWIQNARVLDENNSMPEELFPPATVRAAVERFHLGPRHTRIFNHSINASSPCRTRYMSAWAAEIDLLSAAYDILFVQSVGNLWVSSPNPNPGVREHLAAGRDYPQYLYEPSSRVANPGQSLQALTVGSVAYGSFETDE